MILQVIEVKEKELGALTICKCKLKVKVSEPAAALFEAAHDA